MERIARIHKYNGKVAVRVGEAETQYLEPADAEKLSKALALAADQVANNYHYPTTEVMKNER